MMRKMIVLVMRKMIVLVMSYKMTFLSKTSRAHVYVCNDVNFKCLYLVYERGSLP